MDFYSLSTFIRVLFLICLRARRFRVIMPPIMTADTLNRLKALTAALFWGVSFVATKAALRDVSPWTLIVVRFAFGVVILVFAAWRLRLIKLVSARDFFSLAILGAIAIAIHQGLQATGLTLTSASSMAWLVGLTPVFTAILAWFFLHERFGSLKVFGLAIAFAGAIVVVTKGVLSPETLRLPSTFGDLLALTSLLNWAIFFDCQQTALAPLAADIDDGLCDGHRLGPHPAVLGRRTGLERNRQLDDDGLARDHIPGNLLFRHCVHFLVRRARAH